MNKSAPTTPPWDVIESLYADLGRVERTQPGSPRAEDVEHAIDLVLDGRITSSAAGYMQRDAVRRARFLRRQALDKRNAAAARMRSSDSISTLPRPAAARRGDDRAAAEFEPADSVDVEDLACARDLAGRLILAHVCAPAPASQVLAGLLHDLPTGAIAKHIGVSRSTVLRTVAAIRTRAYDVFAMQPARALA